MTNRNAYRGKLVLFLVGLVVLAGVQTGLAESQDIEQIRQAAEQGNAEAQNALGRAYDEGRGVAEDDREAVKWYRKAAKQGHIESQLYLGRAYARGYGVRKNYRKMRKWWLRAAEQGSAEAQGALGVVYDTSMGVRYNPREAVKLPDGGRAKHRAQINLGHVYINGGDGVAKDDREAVKWYRMAAEQGSIGPILRDLCQWRRWGGEGRPGGGWHRMAASREAGLMPVAEMEWRRTP